MIDYFSVCSGIEAASMAWHGLGWIPTGFSEIEAFPRAVLKHHYPDVQLHGDFTRMNLVPTARVLVGGTPCQDFSIAGLRAGMAGKRGNLTLEFLRLADEIDAARADGGEPPCIVAWENVPGILNDKKNAFGCFLAGLVGDDEPLRPFGGRWTDAGMVAGSRRRAAWRVLDAQYFGLAQRRKRVLVVASARDDFDPAAVLFEPEGVRRHHPPRRQAGEGTAAGAVRGTDGGSDVDHARAGHLIPETTATLDAQYGRLRGGSHNDANHGHSHLVAFGGNNTAGPIEVATARNGHAVPHGRLDFESETFIAHSLRADGFDASEDGSGRGTPLVAVEPIAFDARQSDAIVYGDKSGPIDASSPVGTAVAFTQNSRSEVREIAGDGSNDGAIPRMPGVQQQNYLAAAMQVRRLTPRECERLQGFPDDFTLVPYRGKPAADGPRYKALGNSMAVPVMRWLGQRIQAELEKGEPSP